MSNVDSIGIMDPAFFVGKNIIIKWINDFLCVNIKKIEEMANGAYHCQILDACFPGKVPLGKVNFGAKTDYEFVKNFKVLQDVFTVQGVTRHVDVTKLVKAKYQDNLEFCQWMKAFFESRFQKGTAYNAVERREQAMKQYKSGHKHADAPGDKKEKAAPAQAAAGPAAADGADKGKENAKPAAAAPAAKAAEKKAAAPAAGLKKPAAAAPKAAEAKAPAPAKKPAAAAPAKPAAKAVTATPPKKAAAPAAVAAPAAKAADPKEIEELNAKLAKLRLTIEGLEKERNFYFGKLRQIEVLCQTDEAKDAETKAAVLKILYQTDDDDEFVAGGGAAADKPAPAAATDAPADTASAPEVAAEVDVAADVEPTAEADAAVAAATSAAGVADEVI